MSNVLVMNSRSLSQIIRFTYVIFMAPKALYSVDDMFYTISQFTLKTSSLKLHDDPSSMYLQSPHLGSLHFLTVGICHCLLVNLAFVSNFFKLGG